MRRRDKGNKIKKSIHRYLRGKVRTIKVIPQLLDLFVYKLRQKIIIVSMTISVLKDVDKLDLPLGKISDAASEYRLPRTSFM